MLSGPLSLRSSSALPSLFLRTKVGAKSVQSRCKVGGEPILNGRCIEFGTEVDGSYIRVSTTPHLRKRQDFYC